MICKKFLYLDRKLKISIHFHILLVNSQSDKHIDIGLARLNEHHKIVKIII